MKHLSGNNKPLLNSLHGKTKVIEAFSQFFLTGFIKGEIYGGESERVIKASEYAKNFIKEYVTNYENNKKYFNPTEDQKRLEGEARQIIRILQIDSLMSMPPIPIIMPKNKIGLSISHEELVNQIEKILKLKNKEPGLEKINKEIEQGKDIKEEFKALVKESKKNDNKGYETTENLSIAIPEYEYGN